MVHDLLLSLSSLEDEARSMKIYLGTFALATLLMGTTVFADKDVKTFKICGPATERAAAREMLKQAKPYCGGRKKVPSKHPSEVFPIKPKKEAGYIRDNSTGLIYYG